MNSTDSNRFWAKVEIQSPDECWAWKAATDDKGYGRFHTEGKSGTCLAHRMAYVLAKGPLLPELDVLHSCDNPPCCNPNHLWSGTALDNVRDAVEKGRFLTGRMPGSSNPKAKLTEADVIQIRQLKSAGRSQASLAREYGLRESTLSQICQRKTWTHV